MNDFFLRPIDTLFHRSGLPFDAAFDSDTETQFPPSPRTVYGALRAFGFVRSGIGIPTRGSSACDPVLGNAERMESLSIRGPLLCLRQSPSSHFFWFPFPADLAQEKDNPDSVIRLFPQAVNCDLDESFRSPRPLTDVEIEQIEGRILNEDGLQWYLAEGPMVTRSVNGISDPLEEVVRSEPRIGIARSHSSHAAISQRLYQSSHHRMKRFQPCNLSDTCGFWVSTSAHDGKLAPPGMLALGGEARQAEVLNADISELPWERPSLLQQLRNTIRDSGCFKLYLISPGIFGHNHVCSAIPNAVGIDLKMDLGNGVRATLVSASIAQNTEHIGGWDIQKGKAKSLGRTVPAGSVFFFEIDDWEGRDDAQRDAAVDVVMQRLHGTKSVQGGEEEKEGFGLTLVGGWKYV